MSLFAYNKTNEMESLNITISEINAGLKGYMKYSQQHSVGKDFEHLSLNERIAIISHYLHNEGTIFSLPYKDMAEKIMNDIQEWKMKSTRCKV